MNELVWLSVGAMGGIFLVGVWHITAVQNYQKQIQNMEYLIRSLKHEIIARPYGVMRLYYAVQDDCVYCANKPTTRLVALLYDLRQGGHLREGFEHVDVKAIVEKLKRGTQWFDTETDITELFEGKENTHVQL